MDIRIKGILIAFFAGAVTAVVFFYTLFSLDFFGNGTTELPAFVAMSFIYMLLGMLLRYFVKGNFVTTGIAFALPMIGLLFLVISISDSVPKENVPRLLAPFSPAAICIGTFAGAFLFRFRARQ